MWDNKKFVRESQQLSASLMPSYLQFMSIELSKALDHFPVVPSPVASHLPNAKVGAGKGCGVPWSSEFQLAIAIWRSEKLRTGGLMAQIYKNIQGVAWQQVCLVTSRETGSQWCWLWGFVPQTSLAYRIVLLLYCKYMVPWVEYSL